MSWLKQMFTRRRRYDELSDSIREHLDEKIADLMDRGMTRDQAESTARREFGNVTRIEERSREVWRWHTVDAILLRLQDIRFGVRALAHSPSFAIVAILTFALGIGAVTSVYSVVDAVLLKPFSFPHADRLVMLRETVQERENLTRPVNYKHFLNWKHNSKTLADAAVFMNYAYTVSSGSGSDHPKMEYGLGVSPDFFSVLGVSPAYGRDFRSLTISERKSRVAVISWSAWQRYLGGDPNAVGHSLVLSGIPYTVIGILPKGFRFPHLSEMEGAVPQQDIGAYEIYIPLDVDPVDNDGEYNYLAIARTKEGVKLDQVRSELDQLQASFATAMHLPERLAVLVEPFKTEVTQEINTSLWLLFAAVGAVLLIGCVNLANLQLARAVSRKQEFAMRAALGARREQLIWAALAESVVLSLSGCILGVLFAFEGVHFLVRLAPATIPRLDLAAVNGPAMCAAVTLSCLSMVLTGLLPAVRSARVEPLAAMQGNKSRISGTREGRLFRNVLVAAEVGCTLVLLIVTLLLNKSLSALLNQDLGFNASHIVMAEVHLNMPRYTASSGDSASARAAFIAQTLSALRQQPDIQSVAVTSAEPMGGNNWVAPIARPDHPLPEGLEPSANIRWVSAGYLQTLQIPLRAGRMLTEADQQHFTNALISQDLAKVIWPGLDPIGRTFTLGDEQKLRVVGVVANSRMNDLHVFAPTVYLPYTENPPYRVYFLIRSVRPLSSLAGPIRSVIWNSDSQVAIQAVRTLTSQIQESVASQRFGTRLLSGFGIVALFLAIIGIYGVTSYTVSLRVPEFAVRIALGCGKTTLIVFILRQALMPIALGGAVGLVLSFGTSRLIGNLLYHTPAINLSAILLSVLMISIAAMLAALPLAVKASSVDPVRVLHAT